jgi:hypothetical protein
MTQCVHQGSQRSCCQEYYICRQHKPSSCVRTVAAFVQLRNTIPAEDRQSFESMVLCCETCSEFTVEVPENANSAFPEQSELQPAEAGQ